MIDMAKKGGEQVYNKASCYCLQLNADKLCSCRSSNSLNTLSKTSIYSGIEPIFISQLASTLLAISASQTASNLAVC